MSLWLIRLLGIGLINFSNEFLKASYDIDLLRISGIKLFHSLIVYGKNECSVHTL